jgi:hypothetical protein
LVLFRSSEPGTARNLKNKSKERLLVTVHNIFLKKNKKKIIIRNVNKRFVKRKNKKIGTLANVPIKEIIKKKYISKR